MYVEGMTALAKQKPIAVPEFLAWAERQREGKFELHDGAIVAMAPECAGHVHSKRRIANALEAAIRIARVPCEAFVDGLGVKIDEASTYIPDALVNCGESVPLDGMLAPKPVLWWKCFRLRRKDTAGCAK